METLAAILGAAIGVLGTVVYGMYKTKKDHLAAARVQQFETVRDAALAVESEYRAFLKQVFEAEGDGFGVMGIERNLQRFLLDYLTEVLFQCRRAELTVIDPDVYELLGKIESMTRVSDIGQLAWNDDVSVSKQLVHDYAVEIMDQFRELAKTSRNLALSPKQKGPEKPMPPSEFWSYEDERQKRKRRGDGMYT